jgi:hypothetical protein
MQFLKQAILGVCLLGTAVLPIAAYARHHHYFTKVEVMRPAKAKMRDGFVLRMQVIKMNGNMMVAIKMSDLPDYLRREVFLTPGDQ